MVIGVNVDNKSKGDLFRDRIRDLCVAAGYRPNIEVYIRGKKSDVAFEIFSQPRPKKVVIESKNLKGNLPKSLTSEIIGDYTPAVERREVDEVWVVAENDFSAEARSALEERPGFYALSYVAFLRTLINFPQYLQYLKLEIENDGILDFYVPQRFASAGSALQYIQDTFASNDNEPMAVLSTYGMGKTSLAKVFAYRLVTEAMSSPQARIPIYIPLGALSSQQQIEGLLGTIFTSVVTTSGYNFPLFQKMNSLGHFVILLDGLDEMRHAMTWDDFRYNFGQISKIILPNTKAIMFGRPNTFRNRQEYEQIIEGIKHAAEIKLRTADSISFKTVEIEPFTDDEIYIYLENYLKYLLRRNHREWSQAQIDSRISEIRGLNLDYLIARPVHAQMIANIASDPTAELASFSRSQLYDKFIDFVLRRDFDRGAGAGLQPEDRRKILRRLAWYVWFEIGANAFQASEIKAKDLIFGKSIRTEAREREVLSGALIEAKAGENFYFAHRSFQEFLISESIVQGERRLSRLGVPIDGLTDEIMDFVAESDDRGALARLFDDLALDVSRYSKRTLEISLAIFKRLVALSVIKAEPAELALHNYCLGVRLLGLFGLEKGIHPELERVLQAMRHNSRASGDERNYVLAMAFHFVVIDASASEVTRTAIAKSILRMTFAAVPLQRYLEQIRGSRGNIITVRRQDGPQGAVLRTGVSFGESSFEDIRVSIDLVKAVSSLARGPGKVSVEIPLPEQQTFSFKLDQVGPLRSPEIVDIREIFREARRNVRFIEAVDG